MKKKRREGRKKGGREDRKKGRREGKTEGRREEENTQQECSNGLFKHFPRAVHSTASELTAS